MKSRPSYDLEWQPQHAVLRGRLQSQCQLPSFPLKTSKAADLRKFLFWAVTHGQEGKYTAPLRFVPIPKPVLVVAEKAIAKIHS